MATQRVAGSRRDQHRSTRSAHGAQAGGQSGTDRGGAVDGADRHAVVANQSERSGTLGGRTVAPGSGSLRVSNRGGLRRTEAERGAGVGTAAGWLARALSLVVDARRDGEV